MKLAQTGALKGMEKNVMVAMAMLSYQGRRPLPSHL
jgi:hypothetical protein